MFLSSFEGFRFFVFFCSVSIPAVDRSNGVVNFKRQKGNYIKRNRGRKKRTFFWRIDKGFGRDLMKK